MIKMTQVLVPTDFSEPSIAALAYGREFARTFGARLRVVHVVDNPMLSVGADAIGIDVRRLQEEIEARAQQALDNVVSEEDRQQLGATTAIRCGNSPAHDIVDEAKAMGADIIIMGTHGRGFVSHLLMGNVAEKVVRLAPCPVLTVHHPEREFLAPDALQSAASRR